MDSGTNAGMLSDEEGRCSKMKKSVLEAGPFLDEQFEDDGKGRSKYTSSKI